MMNRSDLANARMLADAIGNCRFGCEGRMLHIRTVNGIAGTVGYVHCNAYELLSGKRKQPLKWDCGGRVKI